MRMLIGAGEHEKEELYHFRGIETVVAFQSSVGDEVFCGIAVWVIRFLRLLDCLLVFVFILELVSFVFQVVMLFMFQTNKTIIFQ